MLNKPIANAPPSGFAEVTWAIPPTIPDARCSVPGGPNLFAGSKVLSPNGKFSLALQYDGNLVLYRDSTTAVWNTKSYGHPEITHLDSQSLFLNDIHMNAVWKPFYAYRVKDTPTPLGSILCVHNDGSLKVYTTGENAQKTVWP
ncbi:hypothetical protein BCR33DRAFT_714651 [Rhizoclosmatium globosum]|uniref:Bulb-type lectin domain-containing protein n=1 Tax=Rhizoclosmatium globosum TaxID=329046 RepID=A0A1Y2CMK3_9FUNG|nr:hypothetical protein HDU79_009469 [Rhizoclosmatium sp. JEL0117]KAJ3295297.1 hypothetical protein HDU79_009484 [Rhizoclosmatium sp. JEL0117]ORY48250.1 hypothetical protein BCR33DRAFT_714651 [Rhizoclosmatium globosum]|eukprot:ORY48250.1 hypothetical protein BCR33DRAFT_714651 [Rhizoclosmatium globosum]